MIRVRPLALVLAAALAGAVPVRGGDPIDATQYLPLGAFAAWEMIDEDTWNGGLGTVDPDTGETVLKTGHQIISVTKTDVVDGVPRYNIRTKLFQDVQDVLFQFGVDGDTLFLYGVRIILPQEFIDDDDIDVKLPTVFFDEPVPVGNTSTTLGGLFATTFVTAAFEVDLEIGPLDESGTVFIEPGSTVTASWLPSDGPVDTPLGTFAEGAAPLARLQLDFSFTYSSDNDDIDDELQGQQTDKSVSALLGLDVGFIEIDGTGDQVKVVNRAILPGQLLSDPEADDAFPALPSGDIAGFLLPAPGLVTLHDGVAAEGIAITDGVVTLDDPRLEQDLAGGLVLRALASAGGEGPVEVVLTGKARPNPATGGLKVALKGQTKKLPSFAKKVVFAVKQELLLGGEGGLQLDVLYAAGKDPETGEPIAGSLPLPVEPFVASSVEVAFSEPVDVPKAKNNVLVVNPAKRKLWAEGVLTLGADVEGTSLSFPVTLLEQAKVKDGSPTARSYTLTQTGGKAKLFRAKGTSDAGFDLEKLGGKLLGVKLAPDLGDVLVVQPL